METAIYKINNAKIKDSQLIAGFDEIFKTENYTNTIDGKKCSQIIHPDMKRAFDKLKVHLVCICEMPEAASINDQNVYDYDIDQLSNYVVNSYTHGGSNESAGVTITGQKLLKSGQVLNINTPFIKFEDEEAYKFSGALYSDIEACDYEVDQYLFHEKFGIKQMELDFDAPEDANLDGTTPDQDKPKRRGRKKKIDISAKAFDPTA